MALNDSEFACPEHDPELAEKLIAEKDKKGKGKGKGKPNNGAKDR